jgi:hypothetical protein
MVAILLATFHGLGTSGVLRWAFVPLLLLLAVSWTTVAPRVVRLQTHDAAVFASIGQTLKEDAAGGKGASVLLEPIGIIGSVSGLRVVDEVGLVTPWVAQEREKGNGWYARVIGRAHPDYVVVRQGWLDGGVAWAGTGAPFVSRAEHDSVMADYAVLRRRAGGPLPEGAGRLLILKKSVK